MIGLVEILCGLALMVLVIYYYLTRGYDYWKVQGVPGPRPVPFFGNMKEVILGRQALGDFLIQLCQQFRDERYIGIFERDVPFLILRDLDSIKDILIKDFPKFAERGVPVFEQAEPMSQNLVNLESARWRPLRARFSPAFTSGKLKGMFALILQCSQHLERRLEALLAQARPIECRELTARFTIDVILSCAFGVELNSLEQEDNEFLRMVMDIFRGGIVKRVRAALRETFPRVYHRLGHLLPENKGLTLLTRVLVDTLEYRQSNGIVRNDFVDTLMELKRNPEKLGDIEITDALLTAQAFIFFAAGFETSSTTMSHALYELAQHQEIQDRLRKEIREEYDRKRGKELEYEDIKGMKYLDLVFKETLRKYPPALAVTRKCLEDYTFPGRKLQLQAGQKVLIPVIAMHRDPDLYPDPDAFDPERFTEENVARRHPMSYLPFGTGPRNCIGARFAVVQTKIGLIKILRNHRVSVCQETRIPYVADPGAFPLAPVGGITLKFDRVP